MTMDSKCKTDEIEITPEMIEAGADAVKGYDPEFNSPWDIATETYRAMEAVRLAQSAPS